MDSFREMLSKESAALPNTLQEDEEDLLLEFEPVETAFEKSLSTARKPKIGRMFGQRGKFGRNRATSCSSFRKRSALSSSGREALDQESGTLADESSPEFVRRGHTLSEDETSDFGNFIPSDLRCNLISEEQVPFAKPSHTRSASMVQHNRTRDEFTRSCCSVNPQQPPGRRPFQRSHSLALGSSTGGFQPQPLWSTLSRESEFWEENANPNNSTVDELDAIEKTGEQQRERKKLRARRHSLLGTSSTAMSTTTLTSSSSSSLTSANLPLDLNWLTQEASPSNKAVDLGSYLQDSMGALSAFSQASASSPAAQSVASSRKRGVCGSPISDQDDWLTLSSSSVSDARRNRPDRAFIRPFLVNKCPWHPRSPGISKTMKASPSAKRPKSMGAVAMLWIWMTTVTMSNRSPILLRTHPLKS
jgi:hypothetical protein